MHAAVSSWINRFDSSEMPAYKRDKEPMLSATDARSDVHDDLNLPRFTYRTRSTSLTIPVNSVHVSEDDSICHIGPLKIDKRSSSVIQMSGPLYVSQKFEDQFQSKQVVLGQHKSSHPGVERQPSLTGINQNDCTDDNYVGKNDHLLKSGRLGMCNDPYCTTCPSHFHLNGQTNISKPPVIFEHKFRNMISGEAKSWGRRTCSFLRSYIPPVMNPHAKIILQWFRFLVISRLFAIFLDPLVFFLLSVQQENKCIVLNWTLTTTVVTLRSVTDFVYVLHMLLQFRLAYVSPESRVVGACDLVDDPKKIAAKYLSGHFWIDLFLVLPVPQILILLILPHSMDSSGANYATDLLSAAILVQYVPRVIRFLPFLTGQTPTGFIFESAWAYFPIYMLTFLLTSHVVGSLWYFFGLQRVNQCLRDACYASGILRCGHFIDCGHGLDYSHFASNPIWEQWKNSTEANACFGGDGFSYGIYVQAVKLTTVQSLATRYIYSLFWGFQQISTLAGNQVPSYAIWEVLFTMMIIGLGLFLFTQLIGNMQNFLQSLGRRRLDMTLRRHDVELWMSHRRLPVELRKKVRWAERYNWAATRGIDEEMLLENLPGDLQREVRRHLFEFIKKVSIFALLDEPVLDAIRERLRQKTYLRENIILSPGGFVDKMVFIVRGKVESIGEDGIVVPLSEGDVCGEELLTWCLERSSLNRGKMNIAGHRLLSNRLIRCLTNVEAFVLRVADIEEVTSHFAKFLRIPRVQGAIRYESPYWRSLAARRFQVAWRCRKKRLRRGESSSPLFYHSSRN